MGVAQAELAAEAESTNLKERRPTVGASPVRRRKSSGNMSGASPVRARANSRPRRRSSGVGSDDPPFEELLRTLALNLPNQDKTTARVAQIQATSLASALEDRRAKAHDVALNVQQSLEGAATARMTDASLALQMVRDSVLAESPYGEVRLVDPEIDASIAVLSRQLEDVKNSLESREADLAKARGRNAKKEDLIHRWGR